MHTFKGLKVLFGNSNNSISVVCLLTVKCSYSSCWYISGTPKVTTVPVQSGPWSNDNKGVLFVPQRFSYEPSHLDSLVSYQAHALGFITLWRNAAEYFAVPVKFVFDKNTWNYKTETKLFVLDNNTWNHKIEFKLFVLDKNTWNHKTESKLFVIDNNTWNHKIEFKLFVLDNNTWNHEIEFKLFELDRNTLYNCEFRLFRIITRSYNCYLKIIITWNHITVWRQMIGVKKKWLIGLVWFYGISIFTNPSAQAGYDTRSRV